MTEKSLNSLLGKLNILLPANKVTEPNSVPLSTNTILNPTPTLNNKSAQTLNNLSLLAQLNSLKSNTQNHILTSIKPTSIKPTSINSLNIDEIEVTDYIGEKKIIKLNEKQLEFKNLVLSGKNCILNGAAGTGKTTCTKAVIQAALNTNDIPLIRMTNHRYIKCGSPGVIVTSYTRRAVKVIAKQMSAEIRCNTITLNKLLEYKPVYTEKICPETGKVKITRPFLPTRDKLNPLDANIKIIILDESSMIGTNLFAKLIDALPDPKNVQFIFIGDLNQLPPIYDTAILGYALNILPVVELNEVYRQALESPIIRLAHRILEGRTIHYLDYKNVTVPGQLQILNHHARQKSEVSLYETIKLFRDAIYNNKFDIYQDIILCPQRTNKNELKKFNTTELNLHIADILAKKDKKLVYEIKTAIKTCYFSIGDKILYDKNDFRIIDIYTNDNYIGQDYQLPSVDLDYFGHNSGTAEIAHGNSDLDIDAFLEKKLNAIYEDHNKSDSDDSLSRAASHVIVLESVDDPDIQPIKLESSAEIADLALGYAISVHQAQGSEWRKVFLCLHASHAPMLCRELLYTAVTRAREQLIILCESDSLIKGINSQRIKGRTIEEKALAFKGKIPEAKDINDLDTISYILDNIKNKN